MKNTEKPKVVKSSYKFTTVPQAMNLLKKLKAEEEQKSASPKKTKKEKEMEAEDLAISKDSLIYKGFAQ